MPCYSFIALNRARDMLAVDWLSQTHVKNYHNFSRVVIRIFLRGENPYKALLFIQQIITLMWYCLSCNVGAWCGS